MPGNAVSQRERFGMCFLRLAARGMIKVRTGNVAENGQENVDEEVGAAATLEEDSDGRDEDGEDDFDNVAGEEM